MSSPFGEHYRLDGEEQQQKNSGIRLLGDDMTKTEPDNSTIAATRSISGIAACFHGRGSKLHCNFTFSLSGVLQSNFDRILRQNSLDPFRPLDQRVG